MNTTNRGIFDTFPNPPATGQDSPFAAAPAQAGDTPAASSPFTAAPRQDSPFTVVDEGPAAGSSAADKPVKLPERRKTDSPFQVAEPSEGFGFEATAAKPFGAPSFESAAASPFSAPAQPAAASPFAVADAPRPAVSPTTQAAIAAFTDWQEPAAPVAAPQPPAQIPSAFAAAPQAAPAFSAPAAAPAPAKAAETISDSFNIRQLELRAIFGVDREMNPEEILQRSRALPGVRNLARLGPQDMASIDAVKNLLPNLGFGGGVLKLYSGSVPLEFIREGSVMLAVQTDGGFAPGVRETLMIVARELGKL